MPFGSWYEVFLFLDLLLDVIGRDAKVIRLVVVAYGAEVTVGWTIFLISPSHHVSPLRQ